MFRNRTESGARAPRTSNERITQAQLRELLELRALAWRMNTVHTELARLLAAGAPVEPGPLVPTLTTTLKKIMSRLKLSELIGAENVAVYLEHIEPTEVRRIDVAGA